MKWYVMTAIKHSDLTQAVLAERSPTEGFRAKISKGQKLQQEGCISDKATCLERAAAFDPKIWHTRIKRCKGVGNGFQKRIPIRYLKPKKRNL